MPSNWRVPRSLGWISLCVLLCACKSDPDSDDAGQDSGPTFDAGSDAKRNQVEPGELCERLSTIQCAAEAYCCDKPGRDFTACKEQMKDGCVNQLHLDEIAMDPIAGYDAAQAQTVFETLENFAKRCDPGVTAWGASNDGLRTLLQGTRAAAENCAPDGAAADPVIAGAALASCAELTTHACQPRGTQKDGKLNWTCDARSKIGGPCFTDANCQEGAYCENPQNRLDAKCFERSKEGIACNTGHECESLFCKSNECGPVDRQNAYCLDK